MSSRKSAGLLLYRHDADGGIEVLLAHPGGPSWASRDEGAWTVPKGEFMDGEEARAVARREFEEETGHPPPDGEATDLGEIRQKGGKVVVAWALEGDLDPAAAHSNTFPLEWPPKSGRWITIPEVDRVEWFAPDEARRRIKDTQVPFIDRLLEALGDRPPARRQGRSAAASGVLESQTAGDEPIDLGRHDQIVRAEPADRVRRPGHGQATPRDL